jgi:minimal PKS chain-length factor (CLF/KS beta)
MTAVITGIGVVAPNGMGTDAYWAATREGRSGIGPIRRFDASGYPVRVAGEVTDFVAEEHVPSRLIAQTDRMTHFALAGTAWALADAAADPEEILEFRASVITANSSGGFEFGQRELANLWTKGSTYVGAYQSIAWFYAASTGQISIRHGLRGPCGVIASEQAGGLDALAHARRALRDGTQLVVSGGTDASLCPWGFITQIPFGRLSRRSDPELAYLPFDVAACGYVAGEGGAMLIVEDAEAASARGAAQVYGEIAGSGATFDPRPGSERPPGLQRAIRLALDDAGLTARDVDVVFGDAMGLPGLDLAEARALAEVFGPYGVPVTAPKTMTGRLYAGGAALDAATALLAIRDSVIPPTVGVSAVAPGYDLDLVLGAARHQPVQVALVIARGHGGFNAALILRAVQ